ncbi:MAG: hypothetical protein BYD32DRAFT_467026 [Podila humilis]|nr:MAG: hypothetical protein BYD32DRAFT_467026 [Podila humilis]
MELLQYIAAVKSRKVITASGQNLQEIINMASQFFQPNVIKINPPKSELLVIAPTHADADSANRGDRTVALAGWHSQELRVLVGKYTSTIHQEVALPAGLPNSILFHHQLYGLHALGDVQEEEQVSTTLLQINDPSITGKYDALEKRLQQLESNDHHVTSKSPATTLVPYPELLEDFNYKAPVVLEHSAKVTLSHPAKKHDSDLSTIQSNMASSTCFFDTFAHELVLHGDSETTVEQVKKTYRKPKGKKDRPKKAGHDRNYPSDKPKAQMSNKDRGYKSDDGYKSGGIKHFGKQ